MDSKKFDATLSVLMNKCKLSIPEKKQYTEALKKTYELKHFAFVRLRDAITYDERQLAKELLKSVTDVMAETAILAATNKFLIAKDSQKKNFHLLCVDVNIEKELMELINY